MWSYRSNVHKFLDMELMFGLHSTLPLLELINTLIKYAQGKNVYICDFFEVN
jgi:hypothetical protein